MTRQLADSFLAEVDSIDSRTWCEHVPGFKDASIYQLWQDGSNNRFTGASRLVLKKRDEIVAAAEARLFRIPWVGCGMAHVRWGPVGQGCSGIADHDVFRQTIRALRNEFAGRRGMVLRIVPRLFADQGQECLRILEDEGFSRISHIDVKKSLVMDLSPELEVLRRDFRKSWRNCLSKAERSGLTITAGTSLEDFDDFIAIYDRMLRRKRFLPMADIYKHRRLQKVLPANLKMGVVMARHEGQPCAGAIYSAIGDTAVYLFGATDDSGRRTSASYLVQWHVLRILRESGFKTYDLNGINPVSNPGTYHFKKGLASRNGREVSFLGHFQAFDSSIANHSLLILDRLRFGMRTARSRWNFPGDPRLNKAISAFPALAHPFADSIVTPMLNG